MTLNYDYLTLRPFCIFPAMCWRWSGGGGVGGVVVVRGAAGGALMLAACIQSTLPAI